VPQTNHQTGLTPAQVAERFAEFGFNELAEKKVHPLIKYLAYFILPMPVMVWFAALIEVIKASLTGDGWPDFVVLMILQFANGTVGYVEEMNAGNAIAALKQRLAPECLVCRDGQYVVPCVCLGLPGQCVMGLLFVALWHAGGRRCRPVSLSLVI
jgi:H+-transporting ATPase